MAPTFPLEIQDLIIDEVSASNNQKTLLSCQLVSHTFHRRSAYHLFSSVTINRIHSPNVDVRLALLTEIMIGNPCGSLPGVTDHIKKFTINAKVFCPEHTVQSIKTLAEEFFAKFELHAILRGLLNHAGANANGLCRLQHLRVLLNRGFEWGSMHCTFEDLFSCLSKLPSIRIMTLEGISGIPGAFVLGTNWRKLFLFQSFVKELELEDPEKDVLNSTPRLWLLPPPLESLHIYDQFPVCILSRGERGCVGPKMNIADLFASIYSSKGFSTIVNIGNLGPDVIGDVKGLRLRFHAQSPKLPREPFTWWLLFPTLTLLVLHYQKALISSSTDKLVKNARAILLPPTTLTGTTTVNMRTASIITLPLEFDFKAKHPFDASTPEYQSLIDTSRWQKWGWLDEVLMNPFYSSVETLRISIRVYVSASPSIRNKKQGKIDADTMKKFTKSIRVVFKEMVVPVLWEKGMVLVEFSLVPLGK